MIRGVNHVGIAVRDMKEAVAFFEKTLGLKPSGEEIVADQSVRVVFFDLGGVKIELLESISPDGPIGRYIAKKGPGIHHLTLTTDAIDDDLARLRSEGKRLIDSTPRAGAHGSKIAFVHPESTGGVLLELCEPAPGEE